MHEWSGGGPAKHTHKTSPKRKEILVSLVRIMLSALLAVLLAACAFAQAEPVWEVKRLTDRIYELTTDGGGYTVKVIASVGEDGVLLVDSGQRRTAEDLRATIEGLGKGAPRYIISTHAHEEHTGGNAAFGPGPVTIGHESLRTRLRSGSYLFDEFPDHALPAIAFAESLSIFFNGEEIRLIAFPGAHDDGDIIVWFTESKVVCVGALSNGTHFPSVDGRGGDVLKYPEIVERVMGILPEDVTIIPGHGEDGTMAEYRAFHRMLVETTAIVRAELAKGKDAAALKEEDVLAAYASFDGSYVDRNGWIDYLVGGLRPKERVKSIYEPVYYALRDGGTDAAIEVYRDYKNNYPDEYAAGEIELVVIAHTLDRSGRTEESISFFELCAEEFPEGAYAYYCHHKLGGAYRDKGDHELALEHYRKSIELNPANAEAAEAIAEIEAE
jgi:cyclase